MKILKTWTPLLSDRQLAQVIDALKLEESVIIPYGDGFAIACDSLQPKALQAKGLTPEMILCADISQVSHFVRLDNDQFRMLKEETPSDELFEFELTKAASRQYKGAKTMEFAIPTAEVVRQIAEELGVGLAACAIPESDFIDAELLAEEQERNAALLVSVENR